MWGKRELLSLAWVFLRRPSMFAESMGMSTFNLVWQIETILPESFNMQTLLNNKQELLGCKTYLCLTPCLMFHDLISNIISLDLWLSIMLQLFHFWLSKYSLIEFWHCSLCRDEWEFSRIKWHQEEMRSLRITSHESCHQVISPLINPQLFSISSLPTTYRLTWNYQ